MLGLDIKSESSLDGLLKYSRADLEAHEKDLISEISQLSKEIQQLEEIDAAADDTLEEFEQFEPPEWCVPIRANVLEFDFESLAKECQFDVIMMDPPWVLAGSAPTRGVALGYQQLPDVAIQEMRVDLLSKNGFIFIWVINNRFSVGLEMMKNWGYQFVDSIDWVKMTCNRRMAKCHGFYLQHAKETCLIGKKGSDPPGFCGNIHSDVIYSERRGQSQKPDEIYELIEQLVPNGKFLEIFGRRNNLRDFWVTIGNEL